MPRSATTFKPGQPRPEGAGRKKGTPNRITVDLVHMIDAALAAAGGVEYLKRQAKENPAAFLALVGKRMPKEINLTGPGWSDIVASVSEAHAAQSVQRASVAAAIAGAAS